jgi:hypothetical protein
MAYAPQQTTLVISAKTADLGAQEFWSSITADLGGFEAGLNLVVVQEEFMNSILFKSISCTHLSLRYTQWLHRPTEMLRCAEIL